MIWYPVVIEPYTGELGCYAVARFPDVPSADKIAYQDDDALELCVDSLKTALVALYRAGEPMPLASPVPLGGIAVAAPFYWFSARARP